MVLTTLCSLLCAAVISSSNNQVLIVSGEMPAVDRALMSELAAAGFTPVVAAESSAALDFTALRKRPEFQKLVK